jgi:threonine synthase
MFGVSGLADIGFSLKCLGCGGVVEDLTALKCGVCGSPLILEYAENHILEGFKSLYGSGLWRYRRLFPRIPDESIVSLGEGGTPIVEATGIARRLGVRRVYLKLEYMNPTGSLKDRGSSLMISMLKWLGVRRIADDSSGNAGASIAAYSAKAGLECTIYVPQHTPMDKIAQISMYGARVVKVPGDRSETSKAILRDYSKGLFYYASHNWSPYFLDGFRSFAFEVIEQLGNRIPEHIIFPVGGGSLMLGAYLGFMDALKADVIKGIPKLHIVQPEACAPIANAFERGAEHVEPVVEGETIAGGLRVANPPKGDMILKALRKVGGVAVKVNDQEVLDGYIALSRVEGIFCEPTSATVYPALKRLIDLGVIGSDDTVLLPITGFGLKDTHTLIHALQYASSSPQHPIN